MTPNLGRGRGGHNARENQVLSFGKKERERKVLPLPPFPGPEGPRGDVSLSLALLGDQLHTTTKTMTAAVKCRIRGRFGRLAAGVSGSGTVQRGREARLHAGL